MAKKSPYMPLWIDSWKGSGTVAGMTMAERGLYLELLMLQWRDGALPASDKACWKMVGAEEDEWKTLWPAVEGCFPKGDDGLRRNPRLAEHLAERTAYLEAQSARGRKGGLAKAKQALQQTPSKRLANALASYSYSYSQPEGHTQMDSSSPGVTRRAARPRKNSKKTQNSAPPGRPPSDPSGVSGAVLRKKPGPKPLTPKQNAARGIFTAGWQALWAEYRLGDDYKLVAKDRVLIRRILGLASWEPQEALRRAQRLLGSSDPWTARNANLGLLESRWNVLAVDVAPAAPSKAKRAADLQSDLDWLDEQNHHGP